MSPPDLAVLAEGGLPGGPRWVLRAGGTSSDFDTLLEVIHSDGRRDGGGLGGQPLSPGSLMNAFAGYASATETRQVLVRADPRVARVRVHYISGEQPCLLDLPPVAARADLGLVFFAAVLPPPATLASLEAVDVHGQVLEQEDLSSAEDGFARRLP
jgi:hypothetical protein